MELAEVTTNVGKESEKMQKEKTDSKKIAEFSKRVGGYASKIPEMKELCKKL